MSKWMAKLIEKYSEINEGKFHIPEEVPAQERTAFHGAAAAAHKAGKTHFTFNGKKHPVTMKKDTAQAIADEVKEEKDMSGMCCKNCGDKFGEPKSESCMYDAYNAEGKNWIKMENYKEDVDLDEATISAKMARRALANVKAQPKDKVSLKKAPWDKEKKKMDEEEVIMNPKKEKDKKAEAETMASESVLPPVYARIMENRAKHMKGATPPEGMMDNSKSSKGAMDMVNQPKEVNDDDEKGHDDASKAGRVGPTAKARQGDNMKGDKKVIPSATPMKGK